MAETTSYTMASFDITSTPSTSSDAVFNNVEHFQSLLQDLQFTPEKSQSKSSGSDVQVINEDEEEDTDVQYPYQRKNKYESLLERLGKRLNDGSMELSKDLNNKVEEAFEVINKSDEKRFQKATIFTCLFCSKFFYCTVELNEHIAQAHNFTKNLHRCKKCGNSYKHKKNLDLHLQKHELKIEYNCKSCDMVFRSSVSLDAHCAREHNKNAWGDELEDSDMVKCKICKKEFAESALKRHTYYCENKAEILSKRADKKSMSVPPSPAMSIASVSSFSSLGNLTPKASYVDKTCKVCGESFASRQSMLRHIGRKHPEKKDDQSITAVTYVSVDSPTHQYACDECGKRLTTRAALTLHKERSHRKSIRFNCELCPKSYPLPSELRKHVQSSHKKNQNVPSLIAEEHDLTTF